MPKAGWKKVILGEVAINSTLATRNPEEDGFVRYIIGKHIPDGGNKITTWNEVGDGEFGSRIRTIIKAGDVVCTTRGPNLRVGIATFDCLSAHTNFILRSKDSDVLLQMFLQAIACSDAFQDHLRRNFRGSTNLFVNWSDAAKFEFLLPPIQEQARLVEALTRLDSADECYRSALLAGEKTLGAVQRELVATSHAVSQIRLADLCEAKAPLCYGVVQPGDNEAAGVPLIRVCDIEPEQVDRSQLRRISTSVDQEYRRSRVKPGDVLISIVGTIGRVYVANDEDDGSNIARAIARVRPFSAIKPEFLANVLRSPQYQETLEAAAFESARKTLNLDALGALLIPVPEISVQIEWLSTISHIKNRLSDIRHRIESLRRIGSILLNLEVGVA